MHLKRSFDGSSNWHVRYRFRILFASLIVTLLAAPVAAEFGLRGEPVELLFFLNLAAVAVGMGSSRSRWVALVAVLSIAALRSLGKHLHLEWAATSAAFLIVALAVVATFGSLRFALRGRNADAEHISAALSAYLLLGHLYGVAYAEAELLRPGSLGIGGAPAAAGQIDLQTAVYFSFVTLATLGYGEVTPMTPTTRGLAVSEAILGQLYLAVLVARLVGSAVGYRQSEVSDGSFRGDAASP